jgi:hypothetical protein
MSTDGSGQTNLTNNPAGGVRSPQGRIKLDIKHTELVES